MKKHTATLAITVLILLAWLSPRAATCATDQPSQAAQAKQSQVVAIKNSAETRYLDGKQAYDRADYNTARRKFDEAVDIILEAAIDVRSDDELRVYYRELIEKINRYQIAAMEQKDGGFSEQRYEPSPLDKIASLSDADLEE